MASTDVKYIVSKMSTVLVVPVDGINLKDRGEQKKIESKIEAKVKDIVNKLKASHEKFEDPDFGPNEKDEFGALSFYGSSLPAPAGSKYPAPETLRWDRPIYDDSKFSDSPAVSGTEAEEKGEEAEDEYADEFGYSGGDDQESVWCRHGKLFLDGTSSGDVIQGQLGDCWFLSALAVMGASESLLQTCFWKEDSFKEYGLYVLRFYKDCNVVFVIVDDRLPVKAKDGKLIFAGNKDPNELWVPLIEKAYAKLHGCYKALIGGYTHFGLADMTGFCPRLIVTREGFLGFSEKYEPDEIWDLLVQYRKWNCLMGCSIQSNPKEKQKIEADAGQGLHMGHAYSLLAVGEIDLSKGKSAKAGAKPQMMRLVKLRNPWGRGEWEGPFGDRSDEREEHDAEIERVFHADERAQERVEVNFNDGTFFMAFDTWMQYFTSLFVAVNFPATWTGKRTQGQWSGDQGGNRQMGTWISNPKVKFRIEKDANRPDEEYRQVFVGLYIKDSRLTLGADYCKDPLYATPLAFDIVTEAELQVDFKGSRDFIPHSQRSLALKAPVKQPPYNYGTTQVDAFLKVGVDYYIVPSLYKRNQPGTFFLNVFADAANFHLDGSVIVSDAQKPMIVGSKEESKVALKMSVGQYYDRKEQLRERIVSEAKRLNLSAAQLEAKFSDCREKLRLSAFKRRMMDMGFMLTDFPDSDLVVLDADNDGTISHKEFIAFFREGQSFTEASTVAPPPEPPVDDLLYKAVDLAGELTVHVGGARSLREATTWFNSRSKTAALVEAAGAATGDGAATAGAGAVTVAGPGQADPTSRRLIKYDPVEAQKLHKAVAAERQAALDAVLNASSKSKTSAGPTATGKELAETLTAPLTLDNINALNTTGTIPFTSPKSVNPKARGKAAGAGVAGYDAGTAVTGMSVAKTELLQKAGKEAAQKLHSDPNLQKAEVARTKFLGLLRSHQKNKDGAEEKEATGVLRKKTKHVAKLEKRDITKDIEAMYLLNYWPNGGPGGVGEAAGGTEIAVRQPMTLPVAPSPVPKGHPSLSAKLSLSQGSFKLRPSKTPVNAADAAQAAGSPATVPALPLATVGVAPGATTGAITTSRYKSVTSDLWDYLIDCVVTISVSRSRAPVQEQQRAVLQSKSRRVTSQAMALFDPPRTPIPAPSTKAAPARPLRGTAVTPRSTRHTPGHASVVTVQSKSKQQSTILDAKDRLQGALKDGGVVYEEVYRRLVRMPVTSHSELEGDRGATSTSGNSVAAKSHTYLRALFERFDKNLNGYISKDEFKIAMADINVEVSNEDCDIFFNRFKGERPGNIDWKEFIRFFDTHLSGAASAAPTTSAKSLVQLLSTVKATLAGTASRMTELRIATLETFLSLETTKTVAMTSATATALAGPDGAGDKGKTFTLPDNAIFQSLATTPAQLKTNVGIMQKLGIAVSEEEMARVSRIFRNQTASLMAFARTPQADLDLFEILEIADFEVTKGLNQRTGMGTAGADHTSSIAKLWSSLAPNLSCTVGFEPLATYLTTMLLEADVFDEAIMLSPRAKDAPALPGAKPHTQASIRGVDAHILCRIIADTLVYSSWNRDTGTSSSSAAVTAAPLVATAPGAVVGVKTSIPAPTAELKSALSFSGLDAYVRNNRINYIERKLKYLIQLEANYSGAEVNMLVHVFFSTAQDEFVVLALDPLSGDIHKLSFKEDLKQLPMGEKLMKLFINTPRQEEAFNQRLNTSAVHYYNPWETPAEDAAVSELISRLRLVRAKTSTSASFMVLAEEPKFISTLNTLLNSPATNTLPFFSIINDLTLTFEVHDEKLLDHSSIRSFVFSNIRKQKALCSFLESVSSSLNVVLSTYNGGIRETFKWKELLSHLTNYRNPFFTIQLLPPFLEPEQYIYAPEDNTTAFTGDDETDDSCPKLKSAVDYDGAPHPAWDADFKFHFRPPQLTNCKVLSTEVAKVKVDDKYKYAVLMVRKGKRTVPDLKEKQAFKFLTVYDPRSATDFQCGVKPGCRLYEQLYPDKDGRFPKQLELTPFMQCVAEAAEQDKIIVGPAITPRLEINVYNECGRTQELLGSCQISVSSVLSGSGISEKQRVCLTYKQQLPTGRAIDAAAGDIQLEMRFRGQMQIDAEAQAAEERLRQAGKRAAIEDGPAVGRPKVSAAVSGKASIAAGGPVDTTGAMEDLRTENDTLALEARKLREKLAATAAEVEALKTTGAAAALNAELKAAQEEQARLAAEKARVEAEKTALAEKLAKVAEQSQKEIAALKEANALALQQKEHDQASQPQVDVTATDEYRRLFEAYEQMRLKLEAAQDRPLAHGTRHADSAGTLPELRKSASRPDVEGSQSHLILRTGEESVTSIVHAFLNELLSRHEQKHPAPSATTGHVLSPLDDLQRILNSYSKIDGTVIPKDMVVAFKDLSIAMGIEQATRIARVVGMTPSNNHILVSALMAYLNSELAQVKQSRKRRPTRAHGQPSPASVDVDSTLRTSVDDSRFSAEPVPKVLHPTRPSSAQVRSSSEDIGGKPRPGHSSRQALSATVGGSTAPPERPRHGGRATLSSTGPASSTAAVPKVVVPSAANGKTATTAVTAEQSPVASESPQRPGEVDWSQVPLPPHWERKLPKGTNRYVYINHETKQTQWQHPLEPAKPRKHRRRAEDDNGPSAATAGHPGEQGVVPTSSQAVTGP